MLRKNDPFWWGVGAWVLLMLAALAIAISGCTQDKMTVRVDYKPMTQEATVSVEWEVP